MECGSEELSQEEEVEERVSMHSLNKASEVRLEVILHRSVRRREKTHSEGSTSQGRCLS